MAAKEWYLRNKAHVAAYNKAWRKQNPTYGRKWKAKHRGRYATYNRRWRQEHPGYVGPKQQSIKDYLLGLKSNTPCADCGQKYRACCMDFDHVKGVKVNCVALLANSCSWPQLLAEVAKCEIVCSNCHRMRTQDRATKKRKEKD